MRNPVDVEGDRAYLEHWIGALGRDDQWEAARTSIVVDLGRQLRSPAIDFYHFDVAA